MLCFTVHGHELRLCLDVRYALWAGDLLCRHIINGIPLCLGIKRRRDRRMPTVAIEGGAMRWTETLDEGSFSRRSSSLLSES